QSLDQLLGLNEVLGPLGRDLGPDLRDDQLVHGVARGLWHGDRHAGSVESDRGDGLLDQEYEIAQGLRAEMEPGQDDGTFVVGTLAITGEHVDFELGRRTEPARRRAGIE